MLSSHRPCLSFAILPFIRFCVAVCCPHARSVRSDDTFLAAHMQVGAAMSYQKKSGYELDPGYDNGTTNSEDETSPLLDKGVHGLAPGQVRACLCG